MSALTAEGLGVKPLAGLTEIITAEWSIQWRFKHCEKCGLLGGTPEPSGSFQKATKDFFSHRHVYRAGEPKHAHRMWKIVRDRAVAFAEAEVKRDLEEAVKEGDQ